MSRRISGVRPRTRPLIETRAPDGVDRISSFPGGTVSRLARVRSLAGGVAGSAGTAACGRAAGAWRRRRCLRRRLRLHLRLVDARGRRRLLHRLRRQRRDAREAPRATRTSSRGRSLRDSPTMSATSMLASDQRDTGSGASPRQVGPCSTAALAGLGDSGSIGAMTERGRRVTRSGAAAAGGRGNRQRQVRRVVRVRRWNRRQRRLGKGDVHGRLRCGVVPGRVGAAVVERQRHRAFRHAPASPRERDAAGAREHGPEDVHEVRRRREACRGIHGKRTSEDLAER